MSKANSLKNFLSQGVTQVPAILPFSLIAGYSICGTKCAGIAIGTNIIDLGFKYFGVIESYYTTYSSLGGILGYKTILPFIKNYKTLVKDGPTSSSPTPRDDLVAIQIEYLDKIATAAGIAAGILTSTAISKVEDRLVGDQELINHLEHNCEL